MNICWNIYALSSASLTLFRSVTRARIYLTNNISQELKLAFGALKNNPRSPSADIIAPVFLDARWCDPKRRGSDAPVPTRFTLIWSQGTHTPDDIRPLADMLQEHLGPRGIPYCFQRGRFVTTDLNPTTLSHSTPTTQSNNYGQKLEPFQWLSWENVGCSLMVRPSLAESNTLWRSP